MRREGIVHEVVGLQARPLQTLHDIHCHTFLKFRLMVLLPSYNVNLTIQVEINLFILNAKVRSRLLLTI